MKLLDEFRATCQARHLAVKTTNRYITIAVREVKLLESE